MGIPVRSAVSIILALEKCVSWAFSQSTHWCRLKSSCDTCLSPRTSANSCLHSRSSRFNSFTFSRYRVRLLLELSLESTLAPRRLDRGLVARKGGFGGGPNVNWAASSRSASNSLMCLWKTSFNHSTPPGLSKWIPSEDASSGKLSSDYLVQVPQFLVHFHRVLVGLHVVRVGANCEYGEIHLNPLPLQDAAHFIM